MSFEKHYKGYIVKPDKSNARSYVIVTAGKGGKIPDIMCGLFTSRSVCFSLIDTYVESKIKKTENAEAKSES